LRKKSPAPGSRTSIEPRELGPEKIGNKNWVVFV